MGFTFAQVNPENKVLSVKTNQIQPNPSQPRRYFEEKPLKELADSIRLYGVLNPLTVRRTGAVFELIAGERRWRAAKMAGLSEVPCIVIEADGRKSSLLALVENLQRADLGFFEEAVGYRRLIETYGLTQEDAARRVGKSQSAVANKLRLLRLSPEEMKKIREAELTERHARALLRIEDAEARQKALDAIIRRGYNVGQTETYIDTILNPSAEKQKPFSLRGIKDVRFFLNTVGRAVDLMRQAGLAAKFDRMEDEEGLTLTIRIPRPSENVLQEACD